MSNDDYEPELVKEAKKDIADAEDFITAMAFGVRNFGAFVEDASREERIATLMLVINEHMDYEQTVVLAAAAIMMLSERRKASGVR